MLGAAFSGFAVVSIIAISLRSWFGLEQSRHRRPSRLLGKVLLATGLMTAYGYVFEVFDALLFRRPPRDCRRCTTAPFGAYCVDLLGRDRLQFHPAAAAMVAQRTANAAGCCC